MRRRLLRCALRPQVSGRNLVLSFLVDPTEESGRSRLRVWAVSATREVPSGRLLAERRVVLPLAPARSRRYVGPDEFGAMSIFSGGDCLRVLLDRHPEFAPAWREHLDYWGDDQRSDYIDASCFVGWAADAIRKDDEPRLAAIAASLEFLLERADEDLTNLIAVGIFESLTSRCSHHPDVLRFRRMSVHLGRRSRRICEDLDRGWGTRTDGIS
jgi:hypothetical protein